MQLPSGNMRILVIDDDPATLELLRSVLVANGYTCLTASGAEEALSLIKANPDILVAISDISMPGMDGITLLERINSLSPPASAPRVIFLTAHARVDYAVAALRLGAIDFLTKPVRPQSVLTVVRNAVQRVERERAMSVLPDQITSLAHKAQELAAIVRGKPSAATHGAAGAHMNGSTHPTHVALLGMDHLRRLRREFPPLGDLDDVAWDLLRELVRAEKAGERLSVSSLSMAAEQVSSSTAMRRIQELVKTGLIVRSPDPTDARRDFVALASEIRSTLERYLERVAREFAAVASAAG
jgi:DNA-binding response OmpR family regulator/DNA-binding MarR family transcriptional regulator